MAEGRDLPPNQPRLLLRVGGVTQREEVVVVVGALGEADVGAVVARSAFGSERPAEVAARHVVGGRVGEAVALAEDVAARHRVEEALARGRADDLEVVGRDFVDAEVSVEAAEPVRPLKRPLRQARVVGRNVEAGQRFFVWRETVAGGDESDAGVRADITLQPEDGDGGVAVEEVKVGGVHTLVACEVARPVVGGEHEAEAVPAPLAGELGGDVGVNDGARVQDGQRRLKDVYAFEEEGALFGEEDGESLIRGDDELVGLDLREVGV